MRASFRATLLAPLAACCLLALGAGSASAATTTINFDSLSGPSLFCSAATPPLTIGHATFSGGVIMKAVTGLPADQTTVYGTSTCPGYSNTITIAFDVPVTDFSVEVLNGDVTTISYTVADDLGGTVTKSLTSNATSGHDTFALPDAGITSVTIARTTPAAFWDFFIDNVSFTPFPTTFGECKKGGWMSFGVFKNQGDCVSYVATHGKNPPAGG